VNDRSKLRHDLKTPLNAILGYSEMLIEEVPQPFVGDLQRIRAAGHKLLGMIEDAFADGEPTRSTTPAQDKPPAPSPVESARTGPSGRILAVDDVEENRDVLKRHLERQGHTVWLAENGRRALEVLDTEDVEVVLLDIMMPEMDGYQTLEAIRRHPTHSETPVLMISAVDEVESVVRCIERGAEDYLPKPFNPVLLRARITTCLHKKRTRDTEKAFLAAVQQVTHAAAAIEAGSFDAVDLGEIQLRTDELGAMARMFGSMAREVRERETRLQRQVEALRVEVDDAKKSQQVAEITETDYFRHLQEKARVFRDRKPPADSG